MSDALGSCANCGNDVYDDNVAESDDDRLFHAECPVVVDPIAEAFRLWVEETDPPPTGIDIAAWIHVVRTYAPREVTIMELNVAGRKAWGDYWRDLKESV